MKEPKDLPGWRRWGRRISFWVLLAAVLVMVLRILQRYPVEVEVTYRYGAARNNLTRAVMVYRAGSGEELRRVRFSYERRPATATQQHRVRLPRGEYSVAVELSYSRHPGGEETIRVTRPLIIEGQGRASIYLDRE